MRMLWLTISNVHDAGLDGRAAIDMEGVATMGHLGVRGWLLNRRRVDVHGLGPRKALCFRHPWHVRRSHLKMTSVRNEELQIEMPEGLFLVITS